jgi:hypothetical protein
LSNNFIGLSYQKTQWPEHLYKFIHSATESRTVNMKKVEVEKEGEIGVKARSVLWYLTFFGAAINFIIRINASIAIVDMIDSNYKKTPINFTLTSELNEIESDSKHVSLERRFLDFLGVSHVKISDEVNDRLIPGRIRA